MGVLCAPGKGGMEDGRGGGKRTVDLTGQDCTRVGTAGFVRGAAIGLAAGAGRRSADWEVGPVITGQMGVTGGGSFWGLLRTFLGGTSPKES